MFILPSGAACKRFINEINRLLNLRTNESPLKNVAIKATHVTPGLPLQKPIKVNALGKRLKLWEERKILEFLDGSRAIQERLQSNNTNEHRKNLS